MQQDCTIFRIPRQSQAEPAAKDFDVTKMETIQLAAPTDKQPTTATGQNTSTSKQSDFVARKNSPAAEQGGSATQQCAFFSLQSNQQPKNSIFPLYDELNFIAEELEKWRSKIY